MAAPIVLDKSSFQGLNYGDIIELHRYYNVNVTPLLVNEILGDLSKDEKVGKKSPKEEVINLSKKMFPYNSYVNIGYENLIQKSLLGEFVDNDNRPFLMAEKSVSAEGKSGLIFKETEEEKSIKRWKEGKFDSVDEIISDVWRAESMQDDVIPEFKKQFGHLADIRANNKQGNEEKLQELKAKYLERMNIELEPEEALTIILDYFKISGDVQESILARWHSKDYKDLETFAPYAVYCYSVAAMYYLGIENNIYSDRKTNLLDLQYLYYLPFAKVFSTNDKFLKSLYEIVQPKNVDFISLASLKDDLQKFQKINTPENWSKVPPDKDTETFRIWDKIFDLKLSERLKPSEKDYERARKEFDEILKIAETGKSGSFNGEPDFLVKESFYSLNDPCPCKSGKTLGECHMKGKTP